MTASPQDHAADRPAAGTDPGNGTADSSVSPPSTTGGAKLRDDFAFVGGILVGVLLLVLVHVISGSGSPKQPPAPVTGNQTADYWQTVIVPLHRLRYDFPRGADESLSAYGRRQAAELTAALRRARSASSTGVDPDLLSLTRWVLEGVDLELLAAAGVAHAQPYVEQQWLDLSIGEHTQLTNELFDTISETEFNALPVAMQIVYRRLVGLRQMRDLHFREMHLLQTHLRTRYQAFQGKFELPELSPAAEAELQAVLDQP